MKKLFILTTLCLMLAQITQAQQAQIDTNKVVNLKLEKQQANVYNGIIVGVFGAMITGIGYATYKDATRFEKNTLEYKLYGTHYENKERLAKFMMIGGGAMMLVGGGISITAYKKMKINLLYKEICLSLDLN